MKLHESILLALVERVDYMPAYTVKHPIYLYTLYFSYFIEAESAFNSQVAIPGGFLLRFNDFPFLTLLTKHHLIK